MAVAALEVEELRCRLGGVDAVAGVSFSVPEGCTAGLIGPNGAGKTTLVGLISGTRLPDAGTVRLFGEDISPLPAWKRSRLGLARTFQLSGEFARLTVLVTRPERRSGARFFGAAAGEPWSGCTMSGRGSYWSGFGLSTRRTSMRACSAAAKSAWWRS